MKPTTKHTSNPTNKVGTTKTKNKRKRVKLDEKLSDIRVVKVRLEPNKKLDNILLNYATAANAVYNQLLFLNKIIYESRKEDLEKGVQVTEVTPLMPTNKYGLINFINAYKEEGYLFPWWEQVSKEVFESAATDLADAFESFFDPTLSNQYPTFRKRPTMVRAGKLSFTINTIPDDNILTTDGRGIKLPVPTERKRIEFGLNSKQNMYIKVAQDKRLAKMAKLVEREHATVQAVTYSYKGGYWWASVRLRVLKRHARQYERRTDNYIGGECGIDLGFGNMFLQLSKPVPGVTDEEGRIFAPKFLRRQAKKLAKIQQEFAQCTKGSKRANKCLRKLQRLHHQVSAERKRWLSELATILLGVFDTIKVEDLSLLALAKRKKGRRYSFGASVGDSGFGMFVELLQRKSLRYKDTRIVVAHKFFPSSKMCSGCGRVKDTLPLNVRTYVCEYCGLKIDRDLNAAKNLEAYEPGWKPAKRTKKSKKNNKPIGGSKPIVSDSREQEIVRIEASASKPSQPQVGTQACRQSSGCLEQRDQHTHAVSQTVCTLDDTTHVYIPCSCVPATVK